MSRKIRFTLLAVIAMVLLALPAFAADRISFTENQVTVNEGDSVALTLNREGAALEDGDLSYKVDYVKIASVSDDGTLTGLKKGNCTVTATLKVGKKTFRAQATVQVVRPVTKVTLNTGKMNIYYPDDAAVTELLREDTVHQVIILPAGKGLRLSATCTPSDANNTAVVYSVTDEAVAKVNSEGNTLTGKQPGECDLTVASKKWPDVNETYHILVVQPVKAMTIVTDGGRKVVSVGGELQLDAQCSPADATIQDVTWVSKNPNFATVDENGIVTGVKRGNAVIEAQAADGSGVTKTISLTVAQPAESVRMKMPSLDIVAGSYNSKQVSAVVEPSSATDRTVTWSSSDESIATVNAKTGMVTGVTAGTCTIIATSNSNPELSAEMTVNVIQRVKEIRFDQTSLTLRKGESGYVSWQVFPADASIKEVKLSSNNPRIASVDENGYVIGMSRGTTNIVATATDGSNKKGSVKVTVTQPVEGVKIQYQTYHVQLYRSLNIRAVLQPKDASITNCSFWAEDPRIITVSNKNNNNACSVQGQRIGTTRIWTETEDGGFTASAEVRVADYNGAVRIDDLWIDSQGRIKIILRNYSDFIIEKVYFRIECVDSEGNPVICNRDGESTWFDGRYPIEMYPSETSIHGRFDFSDLIYPEDFGGVRMFITGWDDVDGYHRDIPEEEQPLAEYLPMIYTDPYIHYGY